MNGISLLAIDPGNEESAFVIYDGTAPKFFGKWPNQSLLRSIDNAPGFDTAHMAIETLKPRGMPTAFEEMQAQFWAGRFAQAWDHRHGGERFGVNAPAQVFRMDVKMHLCGRTNANDSNIRQSLIDLFGGKNSAIGGIKCHACGGKGWRGRNHDQCDYCKGEKWQYPPGPLKGITEDCWSALAIAKTHWDQRIEPLEAKP